MKNLLLNLVEVCFGCSHAKTSFPRSRVNGSQYYVVCLDCGKEFDYDWQEMKIVAAISGRHLRQPGAHPEFPQI